MAMLTAGGLELQQTEAVRIASEDLHISWRQIGVDYVFENVSGSDVTLTLAFPLPPIEASQVEGYDVIDRETPRFIQFSTTVDGLPVAAREHVEIIGSDGNDVTSVFEALGLPLTPFAEVLAPWNEMPPEIAEPLRALGLLVTDENGYDQRQWTTHVTYLWETTFPAGRLISVHHEYQPVSGAYFPPFYEGDWSEDYENYYRTRYCAGDGEWRTFDRMAREGFLAAYETGYVLTTGANWAGPIGRFKLTVDKSASDNLVSLCWADGLTKVAPTLFTFEADNYTPHQDVDMIVVSRGE
ncbi:MAG: DUF4424 family protein [Cucumibacter sp.]